MRIELDWTRDVAFTAKIRQFTVQLDEPESFHGTDTGPSAAEYLAMSVGGCLGTSFAFCARNVDLPVKAIKVIVDVELHHEAAEASKESPGKNPLRIANLKVDIKITLENDEDMDVYDLCVESFKKYCVVTQSVIEGVPVVVTVTKDA